MSFLKKSSLLVSLCLGLFVFGSLQGTGCSNNNTNNNNDAGQTEKDITKDTNNTTPDKTTNPPDKTTNPPEKPVTQDETTPTEKPPTSSVTWYKHVQPIIRKNCESCHTKGGAGPFALTNYEEVKAKGKAVEWSVKNRRMPPWMPDGKDCYELKHSRRLTQAQIDTITQWVAGGMAEGDPKDEVPYNPPVDQLDSVDSEVGMQDSYTPSGKTPDDYHCFLTQKALTTQQTLTGFRFLPGAKSMVHHVLIYSVTDSYAQQLESSKGKHWACTTGALFTSGSVSKSKLIGVWVPGTDVIRFPKDTGMTMQAGEHIVLEMHYNLNALKGPLPDKSKIQLQFAKTPVKHQLKLALQVQLALSVPANSTNHDVNHTLNVPNKIKVWGFMPHMHKFGTKYKVMHQKSDGSKSCLVDISRWDYNWQQTYFFKQPIEMERGEKTFMTCTYDNPTSNRLRWGDRTEDEMCLNFYFVSAP